MDFKNPTRPRAPSTKEHVIWQPSRRPSLQDRTVSSPAENHDKSVSLDTSDRTKSVPRPLNKISHGTEDRRTSNRQTDPVCLFCSIHVLTYLFWGVEAVEVQYFR